MAIVQKLGAYTKQELVDMAMKIRGELLIKFRRGGVHGVCMALKVSAWSAWCLHGVCMVSAWCAGPHRPSSQSVLGFLRLFVLSVQYIQWNGL